MPNDWVEDQRIVAISDNLSRARYPGGPRLAEGPPALWTYTGKVLEA